MQLAMLTNFLTYGYLIIVGFVFLIMLLQILGFYVAGKATGSIDDEITSAFTLFGALLFIGVGSSLINAGISHFLTGMIIPGIFSFIIYVIAIIFAIVKIYELSIGKAILYLILSTIITFVSVGILIFVGIKLIPEQAPSVNTTETGVLGEMEEDENNEETNNEETNNEEANNDPDAMMFFDETPETIGEPIIEESVSTGPSLPGRTPQ